MPSDPDNDLPKKIEIGDVLAGKYRIEDLLGEGGMGAVFRAVHVGLDQKVAVKSLLPQMTRSEEHVARFTQEAKTLAKLQSEHVARVFDVGTHENGVPYMVLEYLDGCDLGALVDKRGPLPVEEACDLAIQICAGLADVHAAGIIHRDLKPSNVYVVPRGDGTNIVKLLDFGISKFQGAAMMTRTTAIMGSPGYMSPEQMRSTKDVDERADIWALGTILYELLTGRPAFVAENAPMLCLKIASDDPDPPRSVRTELPHAIEHVVLTCLAKSPDARYGNVGEVAGALKPFAPERMRALVDKIDAILKSAKIPPRSGNAATAAKNPHDQPTVRAGGQPEEVLAATVHGERTSPPPILQPRRRSRSKMGIFVMGSILGAGVAVAYFGDVQKIRAQIESYVAKPSAHPPPAPSDTPSATAPGATSAPPPVAPPDAASTAALDLDTSDAGYDDDDGGDDDEEDDLDDAAPAVSSDAGATPVAKPAPPKKHPRPTRPHRPPRRRRRR
jgi:serine/threonine-protein kinase